MIALIAAVPLETVLLRRFLSPCEVRNCGGRDLFLGSRSGPRIGLLHSGIGKANAAAATATLLGAYRPTAVIAFGCGGALPGANLQVGDLAVATEEIYGDEGVRAPSGFLDMRELDLPLAQRDGQRYFNHFPVAPALLEKIRALLVSPVGKMFNAAGLGPFVTVSTCSGTLAAGEELVRRTGGLCENMEGAAIAQVCLQCRVPFMELRGISNLVEDRDLSRWDLTKASETAQFAVQELLKHWHDRKESA